ncbi:putative L-cysteine desulfhydrase 1 isoform X1 [Sorghum bicolor]|uniref:putative L-cysteine desulfhydrase 1 isoform X1 n=1 Tax=Sorghum bicolor TaxID=4558 RepID=UPI000B426941|nr:putative L-cysteine desulfhydrase 1 isoform X1 [Sorghum bicolor]|eukprot:XP_021312410.1 putative L-cysteine desulfhydrase 1 isoform X1 [Sorghum bicolor]
MASDPAPDDAAAAENGHGNDNGHGNGNGNGNGNGPSPKRARSVISADEIRTEFAHHDAAVARVNNGSFGCCPASVLAAQAHWQGLFLAQPDAFYFHGLQQGLLRSRAAVAEAVGAGDVSEVSLVDNATTAAAIVLQHAAWSFAEGRFASGDAVLMLHYAYGAVKKSIHAYVARAGATVVEVPLPFPVASADAIIAEFRAALAVAKEGGRRVRLAVIDHITSMPSVVIPVKELVAICREEGVDKVFVDAAHSIGQVPVDVRDIGADFYTSNLHKWFFCPPAVAFLHTRKDPIASQLHHPVVSHEYGNGLPMESGWIGTRDYSAQLVVSEAIDFVNRFEGGIEGIRSRNHEKVIEMGMMLAEAWGTFLGTPPELCGSMVMVGMPGCLGVESDDDALRVRTMLRKDFQVEVPIYYNSRRVEGQEMAKDRNGDPVTGYVRISHQVYNVTKDYERLRDAVNKLVSEGFTSINLRPSEKVHTLLK